MEIKCVTVRKRDLPKDIQQVYFVPEEYQLTIGQIYAVYAISIWKGILHYLIVVNDEHKPDWFPADLFSVMNTLLPGGFHHRYFGLQDPRGVMALWGYKEMVKDPDYYRGLIELEDWAVKIFLKRKKEIDEWQKTSSEE